MPLLKMKLQYLPESTMLKTTYHIKLNGNFCRKETILAVSDLFLLLAFSLSVIIKCAQAMQQQQQKKRNN